MITHRRRQDVVTPHLRATISFERQLECRATPLLSRRRHSVVARRKKGDELPPPRSRRRMSLPYFRVHKDTTGGARPHFGFSAFLEAFSTSIETLLPIYGKSIPTIMTDELCV
ncbi:hypothetical protein TNIN_493931 [Trichonephila inaurata madagascariensis]|uniref:Uncharacterized protein n=1 Tax=Trichonephila inaurata madagascariensis TaxID=2747483 RepID=A0A8X6MF23_9ARAC|nr:hypothetical protein TNIN_493931 [Trichonephila inaurata madagascariensis]